MIARNPDQRSESNWHRHGPPKDNQSIRVLRRCVNAGWTPPPITTKAQMRHRWFRDKVFAAQLRARAGQELPGDAAFLASIAKDPPRAVCMHCGRYFDECRCGGGISS